MQLNLTRSCDKVGSKRQVSFNKELYIRYRTTSEESSNSTLKDRKGNNQNGYHSSPSLIKSPESYRSISYHKTYTHPKTEKSVMEKKFDKLLNEKCTWSYKTQRVRSNKITKEDDSTLHLESTLMTIEISENTLDKEINNKSPEKNLNNMENKSWLNNKQVKPNGTKNYKKNYKKRSARNIENNAYSPLKKMFNDNRGKTLPKKTMLVSSKRLSSQKLSNSDRVLRKSSLKPKDETTVLSSSSDEEVLQARNPAYDKVIYEKNDNSDSCNMSDKEIVSDEEILESRDITKKTSPIIIQATPYINQNDADSTNQNFEGKQSSESDKDSKSQLENKYLFHISKKIESTSIDSLSVEPNTPSSEREIIKTNNYGESNANVKDKSFDNNSNKKHSLKYLSGNIANNASITQNLEEFQTPTDKSIITDFLSGSFDVSTYKVNERYFDYDPVENSRETNLNTKVSEKNYEFQSEIASPELLTNDTYEINIFNERELNHSSMKSTKYKQNELVRNSSIESLVFPMQKRKIKKRQTKNVNKKRKIQCSEDDSESEDILLRKTNTRISKVKNAPKETFIECINLDSTDDQSYVYRHTRNSSLLASKRIKEIGKVESISVINDSDIYSVHDESSLSDNLKKNLDEITKKYLKNGNMQNENKDIVKHNRKTKKNSLVDKDKKKSIGNKNKFQVSKEFEDDSKEYLLRKNRNNSRKKELTLNLSLTNDQHSSKDQEFVPRSKNKRQTSAKLETGDRKQMRKNTYEISESEELLNSNTFDDEEKYRPQRQKCSDRNKIKLHENKAKGDNNNHLLRENKNKKSNIHISDDGSARNQKYLTRSKYLKKIKADNDYQLEKNDNKNRKNKELMSNMILFEEDNSHKGFNTSHKNQYLESRKNRGKLENKKEEVSTMHIENEAMENIGILNKDIFPQYKKDIKNITKDKQKTWDDLENELLKDLDDEMTLNDEKNVSKTIIVRQEKLVRKKDNNTKLLTVSNKSMTQRISKSSKGGRYMQYEVQNTQSEYLESRATDTNPTGKEIIPANSENISVLQKAIAAMNKCTAEFVTHKEVNIDENIWMKNNFMFKENSSLSNEDDVLLKENEPCTSTKMVPYMRNLRSSNKCINYKNNITKVSSYHKTTKKDCLNSGAEYSVNISRKNSAVNNVKMNKNAEKRSLVLFQDDNPWEGLIKKLDSEQTSKNVSNMLFEEVKGERKICKMVLNNYNSSNGGCQAENISDIDNFEKGIDNELLDFENLNHSTPEDTTSVKEDILNYKIDLLTDTEKLKNDSNNTLAHDVESEINKTRKGETKSNRNDSKNVLTPSKVKTILSKDKRSPILKYQVKKDGSLKLKKHSSKSLSDTSSSEYSIKLKDARKGIGIKQNISNTTNKSREKYANYLKKLYKIDSVVERDQTVATNVEAIEQPTMVTSEENKCLIAGDVKNQLQKSKLIAQKDDDVFSVSSSESDGSKKNASHGSGILCEFFDE